MARRSHAARRNAPAGTQAFPARPTLPADRACDGAALVLAPDAPDPDLKPLREELWGVWRGPLGDGADVLVVVFLQPTLIRRRLPAAALPLAASAGGVLGSFRRWADEGLDPVPPAARDSLRRVDLWWRGRRHALALDALDRRPLAGLWDMPQLTIHAAASPTAVPATRLAEGADGDGLAPVSHAKPPFPPGKPSLLDDIEAGLKAAEDRTRLSSILRQALDRMSGKGGGEGEPGVLENLMGWIRWHSPLSRSLKGKLGERMRQVERLFASGDLDLALKLAIALGGDADRRERTVYANRLPDARANLDFRVGGTRFAAPMLSGQGLLSLQSRYLAIAQRLEKEGDYRRAAYIHSQLLNDHAKAVQVLEAGELFAEAAKLALDSRLPPVVTIRLLYKAGQTDAALALARRTGCFEQLAEQSRGKDARFHILVIEAWTDLLLASGQPLRALEVTDALTSVAGIAAVLRAARARWLRIALEMSGGDGFQADLAARALLMASWTAADLSPQGLEAFPHMVAIEGQGRFPAVLAWLQALLADEAEDAGAKLVDLLHALARLAEPGSEEQAGFWAGPAACIVEALALGSLAVASDRLGPREMKGLRTLLGAAQAPVLAADLGHLNRIASIRPESTGRWRLPPPAASSPPIRRACLLGTGDMLIWRQSDLLQLLDRHGRLLWQRPLSGVAGLVAVGSGPNALIVQRQEDGTSLLTRLATHERRFHPIGRVKLMAHHDITSEGQWMVQIGGDIGALDLGKLCAPQPSIEFLWSCALTERVRAVAFAQMAQGAAWLTLDVSPGRGGLLEAWELRHTGEMIASVCTITTRRAVGLGQALDWCWSPPGRLRTLDADPQAMAVVPWTDSLERQALEQVRERLEAGQSSPDRFLSCDMERPAIGVIPAAGNEPLTRILIYPPTGMEPRFTLEHDQGARLACLARSGRPAGRSAGRAEAGLSLWADEAGRLLALDLGNRTVTVI